jgi:hypothetical protein
MERSHMLPSAFITENEEHEVHGGMVYKEFFVTFVAS